MGAKGAALMPPFANTAAMQMHLDEISCNVAAKAHGVVLMDRAGWHSTDQLKVPKNLTIILLPSRSPELNRSRTSGNTSARIGSQQFRYKRPARFRWSLPKPHSCRRLERSKI